MSGPVVQFRSWKEGKLKEIQQEAGKVVKVLEDKIPRDLEQLLAESLVVENLLEDGSASRKYRSDEGEVYGYKDLADLYRLIRKLRRAWKGIVHIETRNDGGYRTEVFYTAI